MSEGFPEQEIRATCALFTASLDHHKQQMVEILGPNWMSESSSIERMSSEQAIEALHQALVIHHSGAGKLLDSIKDKLESWSGEAQITEGQFMSSLSEGTRYEWSHVIADLAITLDRMQKAEWSLIGHLAVKKTFGESQERLTPEAFWCTRDSRNACQFASNSAGPPSARLESGTFK